MPGLGAAAGGVEVSMRMGEESTSQATAAKQKGRPAIGRPWPMACARGLERALDRDLAHGAGQREDRGVAVDGIRWRPVFLVGQIADADAVFPFLGAVGHA